MSELETNIEDKLIEVLTQGDSQWIFCPEINTEDKLWSNLKTILENNNKEILKGKPLSIDEFAQVKNQLCFPSFYKAALWLVGENGKAHVKVQRGNDPIQLLVFNRAHVAGGTSVYQVIHQYNAFNDEADSQERNRRFDVTLLINGLPLIHIELKKKNVNYQEAFYQTVKYIKEGKFSGLFSCLQMFVVSNLTETKYIAAARYDEMNIRFLSGWVDEQNQPVANLFDFAKTVLKIPEAHEMISQYSVLDQDKEKIILLRPYQIHAIESIGKASRSGISGYIWHTTGSGKTLTSYKVSRNLLQDIPGIEKTVFLIDRKDLDEQTSNAFESYAENDFIDVDRTENTTDLINKMKSHDREMIVTTIQKLEIMIKRLESKGDSSIAFRIKNLHLAFVVDECHRSVTPEKKRIIERFFSRSLWYGFTGTPRFGDNCYDQMGDLPRTTEELYGQLLHSYTVKDAIHDGAVLGFQVEHLGPKNIQIDENGENVNEDLSLYSKPAHMMEVLTIILNRCSEKFGIKNGPGHTYEAILTTGSIPLAQKYYSLLKSIKNGQINLQIDESIKKALPDFPRFAITYSVTENEENSCVNQDRMKESIDDYNAMFGTHFDMSQIQAYNNDLTKRLSRKGDKYLPRSEQLDLVIVADRLLTGFDAPCLSTLFMDRQPMKSHDLIQAFSRTNRIFDAGKRFGQIVTFQSPDTYQKRVKEAVCLFSQGGDSIVLSADFDEAEREFRDSLIGLRYIAPGPSSVLSLSLSGKRLFAKAFQKFDSDFHQFSSFTEFSKVDLQRDYKIALKEIEDYLSYYKNVVEELKRNQDNPWDSDEESAMNNTADLDLNYELVSYSREQIDYDYIIALMGRFLNEDLLLNDEAKRQKEKQTIDDSLAVFEKTHEKAAKILKDLWEKALACPEHYKGKDLMAIFENTKKSTEKAIISAFSQKWCVDEKTVSYIVSRYYTGEENLPFSDLVNENSDFDAYISRSHQQIRKFQYLKNIKDDLKNILDEEIIPLRCQE
jgi:type I restriction enzyme R subunit